MLLSMRIVLFTVYFVIKKNIVYLFLNINRSMFVLLVLYLPECDSLKARAST